MRPQVRIAIDAFLEDLARSRTQGRVLAVVVCGSAARGEELLRDGRAHTDIDVMVVTATRSPLLARAIHRQIAAHASAGLEGGLVPLRSFHRHRTLFNYEARHRGAVVHGDPGILKQIPMSGPADINRWEAVRLLLNRVFEHLKLRAGLTEEAICVTKTYEAIGEAQLVFENRYRPSFRERARELGSEPSGLDSDLLERVLAAHSFRIGDRADPPASVAQARGDLLAALDDVMSRYTGRTDATAGLSALCETERNLSHRCYWTLTQALRRRPDPRWLRADPCLQIYQRGLTGLTASSRTDARVLVDLWQRCPQILEPRTPG